MILVVSTVAALVSAFLWAASQPVGEVEVPYAVTPDAAHLLAPLIQEFNDAHVNADGTRVKVVLTEVNSGDLARLLPQRKPKPLPVAWTPASSLFEGLLEFGTKNAIRVNSLVPTLVNSPQVVAIFKDKARELRLKRKSSLEKVLELAAGDRLKLDHTDPYVSTSGASIVYSEFALAAGKPREQLTTADIDDPQVQARVRQWEASIWHYFNIAKDFKKEWCDKTTLVADAAYMQETTFEEFRRDCNKRDLMAIYPSDIPLVADYPYVIFDAPWVNAKKRAAAERFGQWLDERLGERCEEIGKEGFRRNGCARAPHLGKSGGAPRAEPAALARAQEAWSELRRPANVMLVVDVSQDMSAADKLSAAQDALLFGETRRGERKPFVNCLKDQDKVGMIVFGGDTAGGGVPLGDYSPTQKLKTVDAIQKLTTGRAGDPTLYDAINQALDALPAIPAPRPITTVIVLALGVDKGSTTISFADLKVKASHTSSQILAIPYDNEPKRLERLKEIVKKSLGRWYPDFQKAESVSEFVCQFL